MFNKKIKYYDKNIIILDKPIGVETKNLVKNKIKNKLPNFGLLNRLDKYTSGIVIISRNFSFYYYYKKLILLKLIKKNYNAIVKNYLKKGFINLSILKKKKIIKKFNKKSLTFYEKIKFFKKNVFLNICIKTGRSHQIRLHLKQIGFNIKKEFYYSKCFKFNNNLHYKKISFYYPFINKNFNLICNLSKEMKKNFFLNFLI